MDYNRTIAFRMVCTLAAGFVGLYHMGHGYVAAAIVSWVVMLAGVYLTSKALDAKAESELAEARIAAEDAQFRRMIEWYTRGR